MKSVRQQHRPKADGSATVSMTVNGEAVTTTFDGYKTLLEVLREDLSLTGTKHGCELGECGACAVLMDGAPVLSCLVLGVECDNVVVTTIEGVAEGPELHALQAAFADKGAAQCGYCTPGIILTAKHLLDHNPAPTRAQIAEALSGNLCRCTGYLQIFEAVEAVRDSGTVGQWDRRTAAHAPPFMPRPTSPVLERGQEAKGRGKRGRKEGARKTSSVHAPPFMPRLMGPASDAPPPITRGEQ